MGSMLRDHVATRVRSLREALGLSQERIAERGGLRRVEISKVEGGHNMATSYDMRRCLAAGFGLALEDLVELLDGETPIETLRSRCKPAPESATGGEAA